MKPALRAFLPLLLLHILLLGSCSKPQTPTSNPATPSTSNPPQRPLLYASNYPLHYFTQRLIGSHAEIRLPRETGTDPSTWKPTRRDIQDMQTARLIVLNGAQYESWRSLVTLDESRILDTTAHLQQHLIPLEDAVIHRHGNSDEHAHQGLASITWLDPHLATQQAEAIHKRLLQDFPHLTASLTQEWQILQNQLQELDDQYQQFFQTLTPLPALWTSHPVYSYFGKRYGLPLKSMHWEPDQHPDSAEWEKFREAQTAYPAQWMLWEDHPQPETQKELETLGIQSLVFRPGGGWPIQGDYFTTQQGNLKNLSPLAKGKVRLNSDP